MAGSIYSWSLIADDNQTADGDINWLENQNPDTVNNSARVMMKRTKELLADLGCVNTPTGTGDAIALTVNSPFTTLASGRVVGFRAIASNTGAVTLNVNGLGVKAVRKFTSAGEVALTANNIRDDGLYWVVYDSLANAAAGAWILMGVGGLDTIEGDARYLQLTGGTLTGNLTIDKASPTLVLKKTADSGANYINGFNAADQLIWSERLGDTTSNGYALHRYVAGVFTDTPMAVNNATGAITFSTAATFSGTMTAAAINMSGNLDMTKANPTITIQKTVDASQNGQIFYRNAAGNLNWALYHLTDNAFAIYRYNAAGTFVDVPLRINHSTGNITLAGTITGDAFSGVGTSLTALNGTNITSGTVADARIASTIARSNVAEAFSSTISAAGEITAPSFSATSRVFQADSAGTTVLRPNPGSGTGQLAVTTGGVCTAVNFTATSDERAKTNVREIDSALELVGRMRGVFFEKFGQPGVGVIAQEIEPVLPHVVHTAEDDPEDLTPPIIPNMKSVDYGAIVGVLIEAIKELTAEVEALKAK